MNRSQQANLTLRRIVFAPGKTASDKLHRLRVKLSARGSQVLGLVEFLSGARGGDVLARLEYSGPDPKPTTVRCALRAGSLSFTAGEQPVPELSLALEVAGSGRDFRALEELQTFFLVGAVAEILDYRVTFRAAQEDLPFPAGDPSATTSSTPLLEEVVGAPGRKPARGARRKKAAAAQPAATRRPRRR